MPRWKLGFSTNAYTRFSVEDAVTRIAKHGYAGAEVLADRPHAFPADLADAEIGRLAATFEQAGIACANVNGNTAAGFLFPGAAPEPVFEPGLASPDPAAARRRIAYTEDCIRLARRLGARTVSVTSGRALPGAPPERAWTLLVESLHEVLAAAEVEGVRVGVEYEPGLLVENAAELARLLDDVGSPLLGANLDVGHAFVNGEPLGDTIRTLKDRMWHVHVEDIRGRKHYHLVPGEGDVPFRDVFDALDDIRYAGFVTVELYSYVDDPDGAAGRAIEALRLFA